MDFRNFKSTPGKVPSTEFLKSASRIVSALTGVSPDDLLAEKIKKGQLKTGKLGGCDATMTELWNAALAA